MTGATKTIGGLSVTDYYYYYQSIYIVPPSTSDLGVFP